MRISTYKYSDMDDFGWNFSEIKFGKINLLVGNTGSGKTRFLNTIFNIGSFVADAKAEIRLGHWELGIRSNNNDFTWRIEIKKSAKLRKAVVDNELLRNNTTGEIIFERDQNHFSFLGKELPKLSQSQSGLMILKDETVINPISKGFGQILRRHFSFDALLRVTEYGSLEDELVHSNHKMEIDEIFEGNFPLNLNLFLLQKYHPIIFNEISTYFISIFPFIEHFQIMDVHQVNKNFPFQNPVPVFCIKEKGNNEWIELREFSSGMQKVLLILTDFYTLPDEGIYLIDEYENSLGINAIDFLPTFLKEKEDNHQYIITSHHPYLISSIPTKNWYIFHREKKAVSILYGKEVVDRYGSSKQDSFMQLINDPYYSEGIK